MNILIAIVILAAYTLSMIKDEGRIPSSLSATVFSMEKKDRWIWCLVICAVCSQLVLVLNQPWLLLAWVPWVAAFVWITKDKTRWRTATFWAEMVCFINTFTFCLL